jgi:hypothetical protein
VTESGITAALARRSGQAFVMSEESSLALSFRLMSYGEGDERPWLVSCESCGWNQEIEGRRSEIRPAVEAHQRDKHPDAAIIEGFLSWLDEDAAP